MSDTIMRKRRKFYKLNPTLKISPAIKQLVFKRKSGFFMDRDEDIFIKDNEKYKPLFIEFVFDESKYTQS